MNRLIPTAVLLVACGAVQASQWLHAGSTKDGARSFVDTSRITITGASRRAWLKMVLPPHTKRGQGNDTGKWVAFILTDATFDCSAGTARTNALKTHYDDGTSFTAPAAFVNGQQWDHVAPGTVLETVMRFVCAWKPM